MQYESFARFRTTSRTTSTAVSGRVNPPLGLGALLRRAMTVNAPLTVTGCVMALTLGAALVGLVVDHQVITGAPAWVKPAKFAISLSIYAFTFVYLLSFVRGHRWLVQVAGSLTALTSLIEMGIIALQVVRGTTSHFNYSTQLDTTLWMTMGVSVVVLWTMGLILAVLLFRQKLADPAWAWALRLGIVIALAGMAVGVAMTQPTPQQLAAAHTTHTMPIIGAHSVGVADGGPGLPFLGWSTVGGDLRIPHFVGIHALQAMLIVGLLLSARMSRLSAGRRVALVWTAGLAYFGLMLITFVQAERGQSLVHPDAATLAQVGLLALGTLVAAAVIVRRGRRTEAGVRQQA